MGKQSGHKIVITAIVSIILTILIISLINVGLSLFLERPDYEDFCGEFKTQEVIDSEERCEEIGGRWNPEGKTYPRPVETSEEETEMIIEGYCDRDFECREELEDARKSYNQVRYYVFAGLGFLLLLAGLFTTIPLIQYTGLPSGGILITQGIVTNFENKTTVFISLLLILIIFAIIAWRVINRLR